MNTLIMTTNAKSILTSAVEAGLSAEIGGCGRQDVLAAHVYSVGTNYDWVLPFLYYLLNVRWFIKSFYFNIECICT